MICPGKRHIIPLMMLYSVLLLLVAFGLRLNKQKRPFCRLVIVLLKCFHYTHDAVHANFSASVEIFEFEVGMK